MPDILFLPRDRDEPHLAYEVTDQENRPLMAMPLSAIRRQRLHFRLVCLALRGQGNKEKDSPKTIFLRKRPKPGGQKADSLLGLYLEPVLAGESTHETALRAIGKAVPFPDIEPQLHTTATPYQIQSAQPHGTHLPLPPSAQPDWVLAHCSFYTLDLPGNIHPEDKDCQLAVDRDELAGIAESAPETLGPELLWAEKAGILFV